MFDGNILDKLAEDAPARQLLCELAAQDLIRLVVPVTVQDEIAASSHAELLSSLPISVVGNATPVPGLMRAGDFLGDADPYFQHKGESTKCNDALIAAAAVYHADWLVSEDRRMRKRLQDLPQPVEAMTYEQFFEAARKLR